MSWPDEHIERLKALHADGLTGSEIAVELNKEFGTTYSRNAIIGKCHRIGDRMASTAPRPGRARRRNKIFDVAGPSTCAQEVAPTALPKARPKRACSLMDLTNDACRWPVGEPGAEDFYFCGGPAVGPLPYCAFHARMAYQPATERRRRAA